MASGPSPIHFALVSSTPQNSVRIPFENSRIMDECRVEVLKKFKKEIIDQVRFSDVSSTLIACGLVSKDECFEVCKLSVKKQMSQCFQKVHDIMDILVCQQKGSLKNKKSESGGENISRDGNKIQDSQNGLVKSIWDNFLLSLKKEHASLSTKMENELYKCAESKLLLKRTKKSVSGPGGGSLKVKKEDIGTPTDFQHVKHYGLKETTPIHLTQKDEKGEDENFNSISKQINSLEILDENDPDLKEFFKRAGVVDRHLNNDWTKQIIINFIAEHGGMETIRREVKQPHPVKQKREEQDQPKSILKSSSSMDPVRDRDNDQNNLDQFKSNKAPVKTVNYSPSVLEAENSNSNFFSQIETESLDQQQQQQPMSIQMPMKQPDPPANVPFEPTPKPEPNLYYF